MTSNDSGQTTTNQLEERPTEKLHYISDPNHGNDHNDVHAENAELKEALTRQTAFITANKISLQQKNVNNTTEIASAILIKPSWTLETFANLDNYNKDESNRPERLFVCPYCPKFSTLVEREYQRHIVMKHPVNLDIPIWQ